MKQYKIQQQFSFLDIYIYIYINVFEAIKTITEIILLGLFIIPVFSFIKYFKILFSISKLVNYVITGNAALVQIDFLT